MINESNFSDLHFCSIKIPDFVVQNYQSILNVVSSAQNDEVIVAFIFQCLLSPKWKLLYICGP